MASGHIHAQDSVLLAGAGAVFLASHGFVSDGVFFALGSLTGILLSPDLDQDGRTISETVVWKLWKPLGYVWQVYWYPLALLQPHRHWTSHYPVVGTAIRLLYLAPLWWLLFGYLGISFPAPLLVSVVGLICSDTLHYVRDMGTSPSKYVRKRRWYKKTAKMVSGLGV